MDMRYEIEGEDIIMYLNNPLDIGFAPVVEKYVGGIIKENTDYNVVIDLENVSYINSSGLGVLIFLSKLLKGNNRKLKVINMSSTVKKVVDILDANDILNT